MMQRQYMKFDSSGNFQVLDTVGICVRQISYAVHAFICNLVIYVEFRDFKILKFPIVAKLGMGVPSILNIAALRY